MEAKINTRGGVAILTSPKVKCVRRKDLVVNNECIWCEIQINNQQCLIFSVYIPPKNKENLKKLNTILESIDPKVPLLIGGDFNACKNLWDPQLNPSRDPAWQMGDLLLDIIFERNLRIYNNNTPTFFRKDYSSALDITLLRNFHKNIKWSTDINTIVQTDHYGIINDILELNINSKTKKWDLRNTDWNLWNTELNKRMNDWMKSLPSDITPDDACEAYTNIILECAEENIPKKVVCKYSKPFMNILT